MSFILDALRKSEHDRQRGQGPGLVEVAVAPAASKKNVWATAAVALLIVNLLAVGVLLLRRSGESDGEGQAAAPTSASAAAPANVAPAASAPAAVSQGPAAVTPSYSETPAMTRVPGTIPPVLQPALPADDTGGSRNPLTEELSGDEALDGYDPQYDDGYGGYTAGGGSMSGPPQQRGSVVYEHLPEADPITSPSNARAAPDLPATSQGPAGAQAPVVSQAASSKLPTAEELGSQAGVPELHLDIHVYSARADERFVFVNSRKYKEGDTLQEGPRIDRITPDAVELSFRGNRFALPRQ
jgi:general secretion pathway protein B